MNKRILLGFLLTSLGFVGQSCAADHGIGKQAGVSDGSLFLEHDLDRGAIICGPGGKPPKWVMEQAEKKAKQKSQAAGKKTAVRRGGGGYNGGGIRKRPALGRNGRGTQKKVWQGGRKRAVPAMKPNAIPVKHVGAEQDAVKSDLIDQLDELIEQAKVVVKKFGGTKEYADKWAAVVEKHDAIIHRLNKSFPGWYGDAQGIFAHDGSYQKYIVDKVMNYQRALGFAGGARGSFRVDRVVSLNDLPRGVLLANVSVAGTRYIEYSEAELKEMLKAAKEQAASCLRAGNNNNLHVKWLLAVSAHDYVIDRLNKLFPSWNAGNHAVITYTDAQTKEEWPKFYVVTMGQPYTNEDTSIPREVLSTLDDLPQGVKYANVEIIIPSSWGSGLKSMSYYSVTEDDDHGGGDSASNGFADFCLCVSCSRNPKYRNPRLIQQRLLDGEKEVGVIV